MNETIHRVLGIIGNSAREKGVELRERGVQGAMMMHQMWSNVESVSANDNAQNYYHVKLYKAKQAANNFGDVTRDSRLRIDIANFIHSDVDFNHARYNKNSQSLTAPAPEFTQSRFTSNITSTTRPRGPASWAPHEAVPQNVADGPIFEQREGTNVFNFFPNRSQLN